MNEIELSNYKVLYKYKTLDVFYVNKTYVRQAWSLQNSHCVLDPYEKGSIVIQTEGLNAC